MFSSKNSLPQLKGGLENYLFCQVDAIFPPFPMSFRFLRNSWVCFYTFYAL